MSLKYGEMSGMACQSLRVSKSVSVVLHLFSSISISNVVSSKSDFYVK
jgi:hypothetical protein